LKEMEPSQQLKVNIRETFIMVYSMGMDNLIGKTAVNFVETIEED
jgi:hypothetical protein